MQTQALRTQGWRGGGLDAHKSGSFKGEDPGGLTKLQEVYIQESAQTGPDLVLFKEHSLVGWERGMDLEGVG